MKKIEVLYGEFGNMYGEIYNPLFLEKGTGEIELIFTGLNDEPYFVNNEVDMVYMSYIRDRKVYDVIERLRPYKDSIRELIEGGGIFLITGNALEIFGAYIEEDGAKREALGLFDYHIEKDFATKYACWVKGVFEIENEKRSGNEKENDNCNENGNSKRNSIEIIGHRNQFSKCHNIEQPFIKVTGGDGSDIKPLGNEGIRYKNFYATYLLGPFLIMNPLFAKYLLGLMGIEEMKFEDSAIQAYEHRMEYFHKPDARFIMDHYG
ncbi:MAG: hypothetical protein IKE52_00720 [Mogibacterium sp.]|nr:hypothetical protein [Mogibacterium sp.]